MNGCLFFYMLIKYFYVSALTSRGTILRQAHTSVVKIASHCPSAVQLKKFTEKQKFVS